MRCRFTRFLSLVTSLVLLSPSPGAEMPEPEKTLQDAGVATDGASLLAFFRSRSPAPEQRRKAEDVARRLSDPTYAVRVQASADLVAAGLHAVPALRRARLGPDPEVRRRASQALARIRQKEAVLCRAAARLLSDRVPRQAAAALLTFLPLAPDEDTEETVLEALLGLVEQDAKAAALVRAALRDPLPERRAPLALLCSRVKGDAWRAGALRLLADRDAHVRLRAIQGLVTVGERRALPVLIALLEEGPGELVPVARGMLADLAGSSAIWNAEKGSRREERLAWEKWYRSHGDALDLSKPFGSERSYQNAAALFQFQERRRRRLMRLELPPEILKQLREQEVSARATVEAAERHMRQLWRPGRERVETTNDGASMLMRRRR